LRVGQDPPDNEDPTGEEQTLQTHTGGNRTHDVDGGDLESDVTGDHSQVCDGRRR
jgi:hypothetical protein